MKSILIVLLASASLVFGQTNWVYFTFSSPPAPTNLPAQSFYVSDTNATQLPSTNWHVLAESDWTSLLATLATNAAVASWSTNGANPAYQAATNATAHYSQWYQIYTNIPTGLADCTSRTNQSWIDYNSFKSGTNNAAGTNAIMTRMLLDRYVMQIYTRQMLDYLNKLGPGFQQIYQPGKDPSQ